MASGLHDSNPCGSTRAQERGASCRVAFIAVLLVLVTLAQGLEFLKFPGGFTRGALGRTPITLEDSLSRNGLNENRWRMQRAINEFAPHADILIDRRAVQSQFDPRALRAMSRARSVEVRDLSDLTSPEGQVVMSFEWRDARRLILDPEREGPVEALVILRTPVGRDAVEASLFPDLDWEPRSAQLDRGWWAVRPPATARLSVAVGIETLALVWMLLIGGLLLPRRVAPRLVRAPAALLVGVALVAGSGILMLPGFMTPLLVSALAIAASFAFRINGTSSSWRIGDIPLLALSTGVILATSALVRSRGLIVVSPDSFHYWVDGHALAGGELFLSDLQQKRPPGQATLHAIGFNLGIEGLVSVGFVVLLASAALIALLPSTLEGVNGWRRLIGPLLAGVAVTSSQMLTMAAYVNSHVLVAAALFLIVTLAYLQQRMRIPSSLIAAPVGAAMLALTLHRAEAVLLLGLILLATLKMDPDPGSRSQLAWRWAWHQAGAISVVWALVLRQGGGSSAGTSIVLAAGVAFLAAPVIAERLPRSVLRRTPEAVMGLLWTYVLLVAVTPLGDGLSFFDAARSNLWAGNGGWRSSAPVLLALAVGGVLLAGGPASASARWVTIGFLPATLFSKVADGTSSIDGFSGVAQLLLTGGGRVGWGDSVNRMWTHIVLVILLLAMIALIDAPTRSRRNSRAIAAVLVVPFVVLEIAQWESSSAGSLDVPADHVEVAGGCSGVPLDEIGCPLSVEKEKMAVGASLSVATPTSLSVPPASSPATRLTSPTTTSIGTLTPPAVILASDSAGRIRNAVWIAARGLVRSAPLLAVALLLAMLWLPPAVAPSRQSDENTKGR